MQVAKDFHFTQSNLQDYLDCPRRFELRYVQKMMWPGREVENFSEIQRLLDLGSRFHVLAHQYYLGFPAQQLSASIDEPELWSWWQNFIAWNEQEMLNGVITPESTLLTRIEDQIVMAKYDLVVLSNNHIQIFDWKTSHVRPKSTQLLKRIQSRLYPFVMFLANKNDGIQPDRIEMIYWFSNTPDQPEIIQYDQQKFDEDLSYFTRLLIEIKDLTPGTFRLTDDLNKCKFCVYRSFCSRGNHPGSWEEYQADQMETELGDLVQSFEENLDQIGEALL